MSTNEPPKGFILFYFYFLIFRQGGPLARKLPKQDYCYANNPNLRITMFLDTQPWGHSTHETESPRPLHFKHSHWWKRRSWSKFAASHYACGTNGVCKCKMDVKPTWIPTWHQVDYVSWSLGLFSKTTSQRQA